MRTSTDQSLVFNHHSPKTKGSQKQGKIGTQYKRIQARTLALSLLSN